MQIDIAWCDRGVISEGRLANFLCWKGFLLEFDHITLPNWQSLVLLNGIFQSCDPQRGGWWSNRMHSPQEISVAYHIIYHSVRVQDVVSEFSVDHNFAGEFLHTTRAILARHLNERSTHR